jgi:hypothetical protein
MSNKLFLWLNQGNGDLLLTIPVLELLLESYPDVDVKFACYESQAYFLEHLPIEVIPVQGNFMDIPSRENFFKKIDPKLYEGYIPMQLWGGLYNHNLAWKDQVKTFNNQCKENNLDIYLDDSQLRFVELPKVDVEVVDKAVYLENGFTVSGHSFFHFDVYKLSLMFPRLNFYTTFPVNFVAKNVYDCSKMNLIELSNVSKKCCLMLGKGSAPYVCTLSEANKDKEKYLFGFRYEFKKWDESDKTVLLNTEKEMFDILRPINRSK